MEREEAAGSRLFRTVVRMCRGRGRHMKIADSTGVTLSGHAVLTRALVLRRILRRHVLQPDEQRVGILLPPSVGAVLTNLALALDRRVTVNLNYTLTADTLNSCIAQAGIRHVLTSRRFLEKLPLQLEAELVFLEDLRQRPSTTDKVFGLIQGSLMPTAQLLKVLGLDRLSDDEVMTVIFTSGTTGEPKGVMLTYANIISNLDATDHVVNWQPEDVLLGVLPFFHSFGSTVTLWGPLTKDIAAVYHVNPLDGQVVGRLCREYRCTILPAAPMFFRTYLRRCDPADFATLEVAVAGGEKLPGDLREEFAKKFGVAPFEGYGTTEMSPMVASNVPAARAVGNPKEWEKPGTVGRLLPGVRAKIVATDSGEAVGPGEPGLLWVTGPNVMKGYLGRPDATAAVIQDGWYLTGDIATIDADGFITIIDRASRFAKIAGEMVPYAAIENALAPLVGVDDAGLPRVVVTSVPDPVRGERLVVLHNAPPHTGDDLRRHLTTAGLPNLFIPSRESFVEVDQLPVTGSGKLDQKRIRQLAREATEAQTRP